MKLRFDQGPVVVCYIADDEDNILLDLWFWDLKEGTIRTAMFAKELLEANEIEHPFQFNELGDISLEVL